MDQNSCLTLLILVILCGLAAAYNTYVLLLEQKDDHFGPRPDYNRVVDFGDHVQPVTLFDWFRRPFGVYEVQGKRWVVRMGAQSDRWTCPFCLSFWIALVWAIIPAYFTGQWIAYPISVGAISAISSGVIVKVFD